MSRTKKQQTKKAMRATVHGVSQCTVSIPSATDWIA